jgi:hypothetical protein
MDVALINILGKTTIQENKRLKNDRQVSLLKEIKEYDWPMQKND